MKKLFPILAFSILFTINNANSAVITIPPGASPYATLAAAFAAINAGGPYAGVAVTVTTNASEVLAGPITTGAGVGSSFTSLLLRPSGAVTISGTFPEALLVLDNADNVTIDGLNSGGNSLTFDNLDLGLAAGSIRLSNGSSNNIIRNLTCKGVGIAATAGGRTINVAQSTAAFGNNDNIIENNVVNGGRRGIQTFGTAGLVTNDGTIIRNNIVKNTSSLGIFIGSEVRNTSCTENQVFDDAAVDKGAALNYRGINCQGAGVSNIARNRVFNLTSTSAGTTYFGILIIPVLPTSGPNDGADVVNIVNNSVTLMNNDDSPQNIAIDVAFIDLPYLANVFYNTFRLGGTGPAGGSVFTASLLVESSLAGSEVNVYNNVAINGKSGGAVDSSQHTAYDITLFPVTDVVLNSDYNIMKGTSAVAWDGGYDGFLYSGGIDQWKDSTCSDDLEQHSMFRNVNFVGANDSHLGPVGGDMDAIPIPAVSVDIDGAPRNATHPYKGCDEKATALRVLNLGGVLQGFISAGQINVVLRTAGCVTADSCTTDLLADPPGAAEVCFGDAVGAGPWFLDVKSLNHLETYSAAPVAFAGATFPYNFKPARTTAFGSNLTAAGPPHAFYAGDRNQSGNVDLTDVIAVFNDASLFLAGCRLRSDMTNNGTVDLSDIVVTFNNSSIFVALATPCPEPTSIYGHEAETDTKGNTVKPSDQSIRQFEF